MCRSLAGLRDGLLAYAAGLEVSRLPVADARRLLAEAAAVERAAAGLTVALSARLADAPAAGAPTVAHELAGRAGLPLGAAVARVAAGRRLAEQPGVAAAVLAGQLSGPQLAAVSEAVAADPAAAGRLVDLAGRSSFAELTAECRRVKHAADTDAEARRARVHANRSLRHWVDGEGAGQLHFTDNPEVLAELLARLAPVRERLFQAARRDGRTERADALDADALIELVRTASSRAPAGGPVPGVPAKILVRVDFDALLRGYPITGEVCEIAGFGPVAVAAVRELMATGNAFLVALATRGQRVTGVAHLGRQPTAAQQSALEWAQPGCAVTGCARTRRLERDHRQPWADTKITLFEGLDRLCHYHHDLKTRHHWALLPGPGKRQFVPPEDPRHPAHKHPAATRARAP